MVRIRAAGSVCLRQVRSRCSAAAEDERLGVSLSYQSSGLEWTADLVPSDSVSTWTRRLLLFHIPHLSIQLPHSDKLIISNWTEFKEILFSILTVVFSASIILLHVDCDSLWSIYHYGSSSMFLFLFFFVIFFSTQLVKADGRPPAPGSAQGFFPLGSFFPDLECCSGGITRFSRFNCAKHFKAPLAVI